MRGIKLSVLDAGQRDRAAAPAAAGRPALHRRRLSLRRADQGRRRRAQRRAARRVRRDHGARGGRAARPRRRVTWPAYDAAIGPDRRAQPAHLRAADLRLQGRRRVPGLAQRPAAALRHARPAAGTPLARAPGRASSSWRPGQGAARPRARGRQDDRVPRRDGGTAAMISLDRLSLNQVTVCGPDRGADAIDLCVRHEIPAVGLWRDRVAEGGLAATAEGRPGGGPARVEPVPGRLLHPRRSRRARGRARRQPGGGHARPPRWTLTCWSWCPAGWFPAAGTWRSPAG